MKKKKWKQHDVDRRMIDLAVLWIKNEITYTELCKRMNRDVHSNSYILLARALKVAYRSKLL